MSREKRLKTALYSKGLTYEECAKCLDMSKNTFSAKCNNVDKFKIIEVIKLCNLLELNAEERNYIFFDY